MTDDVKELLRQLGAKKYKKGVPFGNKTVYIPVYSGNPTIGLPYVVFEEDGKARISTPKEAIEYLNYEEFGKTNAVYDQ